MGLCFFAALTRFCFYLSYHLGVLHCAVCVRSDAFLLILLPYLYTGYTVDGAYFLKIVLSILPIMLIVMNSAPA